MVGDEEFELEDVVDEVDELDELDEVELADFDEAVYKENKCFAD